MSNFAVGMTQRFVSAKRLVRYFSEISSELVEHRSKSLSRSQDVSNLALYRGRIPNRSFTSYILYHEKLSIIWLSNCRNETQRHTSHEIFLQVFENFFCNTLYLENVQLRVSLSAIERQTANILTSRTVLCAIWNDGQVVDGYAPEKVSRWLNDL